MINFLIYLVGMMIAFFSSLYIIVHLIFILYDYFSNINIKPIRFDYLSVQRKLFDFLIYKISKYLFITITFSILLTSDRTDNEVLNFFIILTDNLMELIVLIMFIIFGLAVLLALSVKLGIIAEPEENVHPLRRNPYEINLRPNLLEEILGEEYPEPELGTINISLKEPKMNPEDFIDIKDVKRQYLTMMGMSTEITETEKCLLCNKKGKTAVICDNCLLEFEK